VAAIINHSAAAAASDDDKSTSKKQFADTPPLSEYLECLHHRIDQAVTTGPRSDFPSNQV
jgi:hypothetical protein